MIAINDDIIKKLKDGCYQKIRFMDGNVKCLDSGSVLKSSFTIDRTCSSGTDIEVGSVISAEITFSMYCKDDWQNMFGNKWLTLQIGISVNSVWQWFDIGQFRVCDFVPSSKQSNGLFTAKVTMFDKMDMLNIPIPATSALNKYDTLENHLKVLNNEVFGNNSVGLPVVNPVPPYWANELCKLGDECFDNDDYYYRDALSDIAELAGGCAYFDEKGLLRITAPGKATLNDGESTTDTVYSPNSVINISSGSIFSNDIANDVVSESYIELTGVSYQPRITDIPYTSGDTDGKIIEILDNAIVAKNDDEVLYNAVANWLGSLYNGYNYRLGSVTTLGMPFIMPYDILNINKTVKLLVTHCKHTINGNSVMEATGNTDISKSKVFTDAQNNVMNSIKKTLSSKVSQGNIISEINQSAETVQIKAEKIELDGETIADKLTADEATIGGWTIADNKLMAGGKDGIKVAAVQAPKSSNMWVFAAGGNTHDTYNDCPFRVDRLGRMWATQANISGVVNAESGGIGRWTIVDGKMECKLSTFLEPVPDDSETVMKYLYGQITLTDTQLIAFDFNCDGTVDEDDATIMSNLIYNGFYGDRITVSEAIQQGIISSNYVMNNSLVTITIDPSDVVHAISLKGTTQWGGEVYKYFGIDSPFMGDDPYLQIEEYLKSGGWVYNTFQDYYDLISSKAPNTLVTQTEDGLMSAADKLKLDGISSQYALVNSLALRVNNDNVLWTFNGSKGESINLVAGNGIAFSPSSNGTIMISATGTGGTATGDVGYVLYEAPNDYGIYCDGNTTPNSTNSVILSDVSPNGSYKRFRIYVKTIYGLACADMPVDRTHSATATFNSVYSGGIIFPTGDNVSGASSNYLAKIQWAITHIPSTGWRIQVTDSGWINLGMGNVSADEYSQASAAKSGTSVTWNQRHNSGYSIYKVVGYIVD